MLPLPGPETRGADALLSALAFSAKKHRDQRRKGSSASPYINHPIAVAAGLADVGGVCSQPTLVAAMTLVRRHLQTGRRSVGPSTSRGRKPW